MQAWLPQVYFGVFLIDRGRSTRRTKKMNGQTKGSEQVHVDQSEDEDEDYLLQELNKLAGPGWTGVHAVVFVGRQERMWVLWESVFLGWDVCL